MVDGEGDSVPLTLKSGAFAEGKGIPKRHTCDGPDLSPPLAWSGAPEGTRTFALLCDDPDAPRMTWVHWVLFDLPGRLSELPEGVPAKETLPELGGAKQGRNDFGRIGYGGPCPPPGKPHRYFFKLYALGSEMKLGSGARKSALERAMRGHVLGEAALIGTYGRR